MTEIVTRFCTSCQCVRSIEGGTTRITRGNPRWICKCCLDRKTESIYKSHDTNKFKYLERMNKAAEDNGEEL